MSSYEGGYHHDVCECCGAGGPTRSYGEADRSGHLWHHSVCEQCWENCSSDEDGNPVLQIKVAVMCYSDGRHVGYIEMDPAEWELYAASRHPAYQWPEGIARAGDVLLARDLADLGLDEGTTVYLE